MKGGHDDIPYEKKGFFVAWLRQYAYICDTNFPSIDLVIPMAFRLREHNDDTVDPDCMSGIFISVETRSGTEGILIPVKDRAGTGNIKMDFLSREVVEGVLSSEKKRKADEKSNGKKAFKPDDGARRVRQECEIDTKGDEGKSEDDAKENAKQRIVAFDKNLNVRLMLHALKFLNPTGIPDKEPTSVDSWITSSKDKPFIAFAMSMGWTDQETDLFIGEKNVNSFLDLTTYL